MRLYLRFSDVLSFWVWTPWLVMRVMHLIFPKVRIYNRLKRGLGTFRFGYCGRQYDLVRTQDDHTTLSS